MSSATCNKCNRTGLKWSKKTISKQDGSTQVLNILLEADGSEHRTRFGQEYVCKGTIAQKPQEGQSQLPTPKPELKVNLNDSVPKLVEIDDLLSILAKHQCQKLYQPLFQSEALTSAEVELLTHKEKQLLDIARSKLLS